MTATIDPHTLDTPHKTRWNCVWVKRPRIIDGTLAHPWKPLHYRWMDNTRQTVELLTGTTIPRTWVRMAPLGYGFTQQGFWKRKY